MGYNFPNWTPYNLVSYLYQEMLKRNITVEQMSPNQLKLKKGGLLLWEEDATLTVYNRGGYIELLISSSEARSFLTGGLIGRREAIKARKTLIDNIISILGRPAYIRET